MHDNLFDLVPVDATARSPYVCCVRLQLNPDINDGPHSPSVVCALYTPGTHRASDLSSLVSKEGKARAIRYEACWETILREKVRRGRTAVP